VLSSINSAELYSCCIYSGFRVKFMKIWGSHHFHSFFFFISVPFLILCFWFNILFIGLKLKVCTKRIIHGSVDALTWGSCLTQRTNLCARESICCGFWVQKQLLGLEVQSNVGTACLTVIVWMKRKYQKSVAWDRRYKMLWWHLKC
jgi:hypothetical protein